MTTNVFYNEIEISLPDKLSNLVDHAILESRQLDRDNIVPYSSVWYEHNFTSQSFVCFACSTLVKPLSHIAKYQNISLTLDDFPKHIKYKLDALEYIREGNYDCAFSLFSMEPFSPFVTDTVLPELYENHPSDALCNFSDWEQYDEFIKQISICANILRKHGF